MVNLIDSTGTPRSRKDHVLELIRTRRLAEAETLCANIAHQENNAGAWHLLGVIHGMRGNPREAERCSREAIRLRPDYAEAYSNLGTALHIQGRLDESILNLREALKWRPNLVEAHYNLGLALAANHCSEDAIGSLRETIRLKPNHVDAHLYLGTLLAVTERFEEAAECFRQTLQLDPHRAAAHAYLGNVLVRLGKMENAVASYRQALLLQPNNPETLNNLGNALTELNRKDEAIAAYRQAIETDPRFLASYHNLGRVLLELERTTEAIEIYGAALRAEPDHAGALSDLAAVLLRQHRFAEAVECYERVLATQPDDAETRYNLGTALRATGKLDEAIACYRAAIRLKPADADAHMNLALSLLALGNFQEGWKEYDWQWRREGAPSRRFSPTPWDGSDLGGKNVFLDSEQGIGDEFFFLRFVSSLKKRNAGKVTYSPSTKISSLLSRSKILDRLAQIREQPTSTEFAFSVGDLPRLMGMQDVSQIPPPIELTPLPAKIIKVQQQLRKFGSQPYIGVTWRGGTTKKNALYKEVSLEKLAAGLRGINASVVILQRNPLPEEVELFSRALGRPIHDFSSLNENLEEMLALLALLDDYIGVSNANMHLRAGTGKTARVLVPTPPEWRWMTEGKESPWFPGFTVYRQGYDGSWETAFTELATDLKKSFN